jgi:hypothetical protein
MEMIQIRNHRLLRELSWFAATIVSFFGVFSLALDLGGGPGDPFDWIAALCLYVLVTFVRITVGAVKKWKASK